MCMRHKDPFYNLSENRREQQLSTAAVRFQEGINQQTIEEPAVFKKTMIAFASIALAIATSNQASKAGDAPVVHHPHTVIQGHAPVVHHDSTFWAPQQGRVVSPHFHVSPRYNFGQSGPARSSWGWQRSSRAEFHHPGPRRSSGRSSSSGLLNRLFR